MTLEEIKAALKERDDAIVGKLAGLQKILDEHKSWMEAREDAESRSSHPGRLAAASSEAREHKTLFENWVRHPRDAEAQRKLTEFASHAKSVSIGTPADGGYAVPEEIGRDIDRLQRKFSPVRNLVRVSRSGTSDLKRLLDLNGAESGWRSETGTVNETGTPKLREIVPTGGELYAYPKATNWSLDDVFFNVGSWLAESAAEAFAKQEGAAVISGDGTNKPTGMLNTAPVTTADDASPKRAAAAYQYILGGDNSPAGVDGDALIDLQYALNSQYRAGASWAMNSVTAGQLRKLKASGTGEYLWSDGLVAGQPPSLLGSPVAIWEDMPDPDGGAVPVAFGDFNRGYELIDRSDIIITLDPYTTPGFTKFYIRKRVYGHVRNNDAIKFLKLL